MKWVMLIVLAVGLVARAEDKPNAVDPEQLKAAQAKLDAKAAAQPSEVEKLRKENAELRREVAELRARVAKLSELVKGEAATRAGESKLTIGMTVEQAAVAVGSKGTVKEETATRKAIEYSEWKTTATHTGPRKVRADFEDGKIVALTFGTWDAEPIGREPAPARTPAPPPKKPGKPGDY